MVDYSDISPDEIADIDAAYWSIWNKIRLANGRYVDFTDRQYLLAPMQDRSRVSCSMKATGGGFSECQGILPTIHGMIKGRYSQGVGYYFPTDTNMQDFVQSRFNPLISGNKESIGKYLKRGRGGADKSGLKRIGNSNLYLRGSTLMPGDDGGSKMGHNLQGIQFDRLVVDEIDQVDPEAIGKMRHRMDNACVDGIVGNREERYIANPSDEDRGVDLYWQRSNKDWWEAKCVYCGTFTNNVRHFLDDPEGSVGFDENGKGYMKCSKCGKALNGWAHGDYHAECPSVTDFNCYQWSHLDSRYNDPGRILRDFRDPPEGNIGDIYRLDLGIAHSSIEDKLRKSSIWSCCSNDGMPDRHSGPCAMGVDNDDGKHVVIGIRTDNDRYEVIKACRVDGFNDVHDLAQRYGVKSAVVDLRPNADSARSFQKGERYKVFLCEYTESPLNDAFFNENTGVVKAYRTGIFDKTHSLIMNGQFVFPRRSSVIDEFAQQLCNCVKSKEEDKKKNTVVYRYKKTGNGNDHYRNALNYFILAASGHRIGKVKKHQIKRQLCALIR